MVPFTPRLIPAILPNLAHHVEPIRNAAIRTDQLLFNAIQSQPPPLEISTPTPVSGSYFPPSRAGPSSPPLQPVASQTSRPSTRDREPSGDGSIESLSTLAPLLAEKLPLPTSIPVRHRSATIPEFHSASGIPVSGTSNIAVIPETSSPLPSRPQSPCISVHSPVLAAVKAASPVPSAPTEETDLIDYQATVNVLTVQFLSEHEQTRVAALKWLIMLHQKAPKKVNETAGVL
jgi:vacuole morphology and inheritance protein 14